MPDFSVGSLVRAAPGGLPPRSTRAAGARSAAPTTRSPASIFRSSRWRLDLGEPSGSAPGYRHPHVVVQNDVFNASRIATTVVCALTSNLQRGQDPGNVLLEAGEADLSSPSVVNISQVITVGKEDLTERIGTLSPARMSDVLHGLYLLLEPREPPPTG